MILSVNGLGYRKVAAPPRNYINYRKNYLRQFMGFGFTCPAGSDLGSGGDKCCIKSAQWDGQNNRCCSITKTDMQVITTSGGKHISCGATGGGGCTPNCAGKMCGPDGCGQSCGTCSTGTCNQTTGQCDAGCTTNCTGKQCGSDGCGGSCGTCPGGQSCASDGSCVAGGATPPGVIYGGGGGGTLIGGGGGGGVSDTISSFLNSPVVWVAGGLLGVVLLVKVWKGASPAPAPIVVR